MKIAYIVAEKLDKSHGVSKKIYNQIENWVQEGHEVKLFYFSNEKLNEMFSNINCEQIKFKNRISFVLSISGYKSIRKYNPDIVYFRYYLYSRDFSKIFRRYPTVFEINSNDIQESKVAFPYFIRQFLLITRHLLLKKAKGFVTVTEELKTLVEPFSKNIICIPNSIPGPFIPKEKVLHNTSKNIIFLGSPNQSWHGIDKIIKLSELLPSIQFHIVGIEEGINPVSNVKYYGYLTQNDYLKILRKCDVAIGTLALHKKNMNEASPLKVREYLKYGIPVIIGYQDSDFPDEKYNFILKLDNYESNIEDNIDVISEFIVNSDKIIIEESDIEHIFYENKEKRRLTFMESTI